MGTTHSHCARVAAWPARGTVTTRPRSPVELRETPSELAVARGPAGAYRFGSARENAGVSASEKASSISLS